MKSLNDLMEFGRVVRSDGAGNVSDSDVPDSVQYGAPEMVYVLLDSDGQAIRRPGESDFHIVDLPDDWTLLTGFTGQYGYSGALMHQSEFIGGGLERHIRENAGYYVAVIVDGLVDDPTGEVKTEPDSWAVAFKELDS